MWTWRSAPEFKLGFFDSKPVNLGDHKEVGGGVWEARLDFGPGYRLYFGRSGREVVLLLLGGDKRSQNKDIKRAREFWASYVKELKHGKTQ